MTGAGGTQRRTVLIGLGSLALVTPVAARRQQPKVPQVGILVLGTLDPATFLRHFREVLRDLGYVERQTILIEFRSAEGDPKCLASLAARADEVIE
jgi:hypothetical protein